jgi:hypothetical protein
MGTCTHNGFEEYRYFHCKHIVFYTQALTIKFSVDQIKSRLSFSWACCSETDNFNRSVGKKLVDDRMKQGNTIGVKYNRDTPLIENAIDGLKDFKKWYETTRIVSKQHRKTYNEVLRALNTYNEVSVFLDRRDANWEL